MSDEKNDLDVIDNDSSNKNTKNKKTIRIILIVIVAFVIIAQFVDKKSTSKEATSTLSGKNPTEEKTKSSDKSEPELPEYTIEGDSEVALAIRNLNNKYEEIEESQDDFSGRITQIQQQVSQVERRTKDMVVSEVDEVKSLFEKQGRQIQDISQQFTLLDEKLATGQYAVNGQQSDTFRFGQDQKENKDEKRLPPGLTPITSGYISFDQTYSSSDTLQNQVGEILNGDEEEDTEKRNGNGSTKVAVKIEKPQGDATHDYITINSDSWVDSRLFHAIHCPIGGTGEIAKDAISAIKPAPIIIKVEGVFKGANGEINDIGDARLFGYCVGRRTSDSDYGRATIAISRLTYSNDNGEDYQIEGLTGYILDMRDETEGIRGPIDKVLGANIFNQSLAAFSAAIGGGFSSQQYETTESGVVGATTQVFTGSVVKDALGKGFFNMFQSIQQYWEGLMNTELDRVMVPSGRNIRVVINTPMTLKVPKSNLADSRELLDEFMY